MTVTNLAVSQVINLAGTLNTKLQSPILTSEMGLDVQASALGKPIRWDEFSVKFNNNGTFKGIVQADMLLDVLATLTKQAVRWDEFALKHNNDGSFKIGIIASADIADGTIVTGDISATANIIGTQLSATSAILGSQLSATASIIGTQLSATANILGTQLSATANILGTQLALGTITQPRLKTKSVVVLADAIATLTATQMIDSGLFTITPTIARSLTTDTAVNLVAGMPGYQVGSWFEFTIVNNAAFVVTLTAGTGITLVGNAVANNASGTWLARIDSATGITMYRE